VAFTAVIGSQNISLTAVSGHLCAGVINADEHPSVPLHWWLARLKVNDKFQGLGIGTKLLTMLQDELEKKLGVVGLIVAPGGYGSDVGELEKWYGARGFVKHREGYMVWRPSHARR